MFVNKHETIVEGHKHIHVRIHTYTNTRACTFARACTCAFACACACGRERRGEWWSVGGWVGEYVLVRMCVLCVLIPSAVSLRIKMELNSFVR